MPTSPLDKYLQELDALDTISASTIIYAASDPGNESYQLSISILFTSPNLLGSPTAPTPSGSDNSNRVATTAFVKGQINDLQPLSPLLTQISDLDDPGADQLVFWDDSTGSLSYLSLSSSLLITGTTLSINGAAVTGVVHTAGNETISGIKTFSSPIVGTITGNITTAQVTGFDTALASKQPLDMTLLALAGLSITSDKLIYGTGVDAFALSTLTPFARTLLDDPDATTARATLGVTSTGGSGTPGGTSGQVQYNNAGVFAGFGNWDGTTLTVSAFAGSGAGVTGVVHTSGNETIAGTKTFSSPIAGTITGNITTSQVTGLSTALAGKQPVGNYITGLTGDITASGPGSAVATLANSGVTAGSYTNSNIQVDAKGRVLTASNGTGGSGGGITIGTTPITGGASNRVLFQNSGVVSESNNIQWNESLGQFFASNQVTSAYLVGNDITIAHANGFLEFHSGGNRIVRDSSTGRVDFMTYDATPDGWRFVSQNAGVSLLEACGFSAQTAPLFSLQGISSTSTVRSIAFVDAGFVSSTDATYTGYLDLDAKDYSGRRKGLRVASDGTQAKLGFYGATPVAKPSGDIGTALVNLGLITSPTSGSSGISIGSSISGGTAGRVLFEGAGPVLSDSAGLTWVGTTLAVTGNVSASYYSIGANKVLYTVGNNIIVGLNAGTSSITNTYNTIIGAEAMNAVTSGDSNTAIGARSLGSTLTGNNNVAIGYAAIYNSTTASNCAALGYAVLYNNSGNSNVALGYAAGWNNTSGSFNTYIGDSAGFTNTPAVHNYRTAIGAGAQPTADHQIMLGTASEYVVIPGNMLVTPRRFALGETSNVPTGDGSFNIGAGNSLTATGYASLIVGASNGVGPGNFHGMAYGFNNQISGVVDNGITLAMGWGNIITDGAQPYAVVGSSNVTNSGASNGVFGTACQANANYSLSLGSWCVINDPYVLGFGTASPDATLRFQGRTTTSFSRDLMDLKAALIDGTDATRKTRVTLSAYDWSASREGLRVEADGTQARLGFYGATAIVKPSGDIGTALVNLGLITSPTSGVTIGSPVSGGTAGRVLFEGAGPVVSDSANLTWDATNQRLGIGTSSPQADIHLSNPGYHAELRIDAGVGFVPIVRFSNGGVPLWSIGQSGANLAFAIYGGSTPVSIDQLGNISAGNYAIGAYTTLSIPGITNTFIGAAAGNQSLTGGYNTAVGNNALHNVTSGQFNVSIGISALYNTTTGVQNVAIGWGAGEGNTTGSYNTYIGINAGQSDAPSPGNYRTAIGYNAQPTADHQIMLGTASEYVMVPGYVSASYYSIGADKVLSTPLSTNTFVGISAGNSSVTGDNSTAVGKEVLSSITSGLGNVAVGMHALNDLQTGAYNAAVGVGANEHNVSATHNVAIGLVALFNTNSNRNVGIGAFSGYDNTTGGSNTYIGSYSGYAGTPAVHTQRTAIGAYAQPTADYQMMLGTSADHVVMPGSALVQSGVTTNVALTISGIASQTAPLQTFQGISSTSTARDLAYVDAAFVGADNTDASFKGYLDLDANDHSGRRRGIRIASDGTQANVTIPVGNLILTLGNVSTASYYSIGADKVLSTPGGNNTFVGGLAGAAGTTGTYNTALGMQSMQSISSGINNTSVGGFALAFNTSGSTNVAIGCSSSYRTTSGNDSVAVGYAAGHDNTTGSCNTYIGSNAGYTGTPAVHNYRTAIGAYAQPTADHQIMLGTASEYVMVPGYEIIGSNTTKTVPGLSLSGYSANRTDGSGGLIIGDTGPPPYSASLSITRNGVDNSHAIQAYNYILMQYNVDAINDNGVLLLGGLPDSTYSSKFHVAPYTTTQRAIQVQACLAQTAPLQAFKGISSTTARQDIAYIDAGFTDNTDATFKGYLDLDANDYGGRRKGLRVASDGTQSLLGFHGATPAAKPTGDLLAGLLAQGLNAAPKLISSESALGSNFFLTTTGTFQDIGLSVSLPSSGRYVITFNVRITMKVNTGTGAGFIVAQLYDSTNAAVIANSARLIYLDDTGHGVAYQLQSAFSSLIDVAGAITLKLYVKRDGGGTFNDSLIASDSNGYTTMGYIKIGT